MSLHPAVAAVLAVLAVTMFVATVLVATALVAPEHYFN